MLTRHILPAVFLTMAMLIPAAGEHRPLDQLEIFDILHELAGRPRRAWIEAGTIQATHRQYRAPQTMDTNLINRQIAKRLKSYLGRDRKRQLTEDLQQAYLDAISFNVRYEMANEYSMTSKHLVHFVGERFYTRTELVSRTDSITPPPEMADNCMSEYFDRRWNAERVSVWDGRRYTVFSVSGKHAIIDSAHGNPPPVQGAHTAGVIPWGNGYYRWENLVKVKISGVMNTTDENAEVRISLTNFDGSGMVLSLDPRIDYAVTAQEISQGDDSVLIRRYRDYRQVAGKWMPTNIVIERRNRSSGSVLAMDSWEITAVDETAPGPESFSVVFSEDTRVDYLPRGSGATGPFGHKLGRRLQEHGSEPCPQATGSCGGYSRIYYTRFGHIAGAKNDGQTFLIGHMKCPCAEDALDPFSCSANGDWTYYFMPACN